jgi:hydroxyacylglutathione hydrolase
MASGIVSSAMFFDQRLIGALANFGYVIGDPASKVGAVIDPSFDAHLLQKAAAENGYAIAFIFDTHHHPDHVFDNERLANETGAKVAAHRLSEVRKDVVLEDGMIVKVGELKVRVVHTPGHSPDSCCYIVGGRVFTGDCLFVGDCGRVDLPGSSVEAMYDSLFNKVRTMDEALIVCPGHHYGKRPTSTIGEEKGTNYTLKPRSIAEFVEFMRSG